MKRLAAILLLTTSTQTFALTGAELLKQCVAVEGSTERKQCASFVLGTVGGANMLMVGMSRIHPDGSSYPVLFCVAPTISEIQLTDAVVAFLRANPDGQEYEAASEVILAVMRAFPCGKT